MHFNKCKNITPLIAGSQLSTKIVSSLWSKKGGKEKTHFNNNVARSKKARRRVSPVPVMHLPLLKLHFHRKPMVIFFTVTGLQPCTAAELQRFWGWGWGFIWKADIWIVFSWAEYCRTRDGSCGQGLVVTKTGSYSRAVNYGGLHNWTRKQAKISTQGFALLLSCLTRIYSNSAVHSSLSQFKCLPWTNRSHGLPSCSAGSGKIWLTPLWMR